MLEDLEKGDIAETVRIFFEASQTLRPLSKSILTIQQVDSILDELEGQTTEEAHAAILKKAAKRYNSLMFYVASLKML